MRTGARQQAAIEILTSLETQRRPAADAVKAWMLTHRFAGSKDRAEIGDLVFGALRWKQSSAWRMGEDTPRAWVWGALRWGFGQSAEWIEQSLVDDPHAPAAMSEAERVALGSRQHRQRACACAWRFSGMARCAAWRALSAMRG